MAFYEKLVAKAGPEVHDFVRRTLDEAETRGLEVALGTTSMPLDFVSEASGRKFRLAAFTRRGSLKVRQVREACRKIGVAGEIGRHYIEGLCALLPGSRIVPRGEDDLALSMGKRRIDKPPVALLVPREGEWLRLLDDTVAALRAALDENE